MNQKLIKLIAYVYLFAILILIIAFVYFIKKENSECISNPFTYAAETFKESAYRVGINSKPICRCDIGEVTIYFDEQGIYEENPLLKGGNITWENK